MKLPGTPDVIVRFNDKQLDTVLLNGTTIDNGQFIIQANQQGKLSIFDARTNKFIIDTLITIPSNSSQDFRLAYSPELGLCTFVGTGNTTLPADSVYIQFSNRLSQKFYPKPKYNIQFVYIDPNTGEIVPSPVEIKGLERGALSKGITKFRVQDEKGQGITYGARIVDAETGDPIFQPGIGTDLFLLGIDQSVASKTVIVFLQDDESGDLTRISVIEL
ncbi:hypothetical protein KTO58_21360 [Chitinophaga pendula]|uniref:hypothetical protein n=1 Tax=Chitinophaga TaxID=79328 RepID=UPI0012FD3299|nr:MULTISPECIES: hypothetical protein [Chitinophaga]UCJ06198.1 hypothetical protein KTO58_21360 [Chitinophaga pendula]